MVAAIVLSNLMYLVGALAAMILISLVIVFRHRRPKSVEANVQSFNRGLRALAPEGGSTAPVGPRPLRVQPRADGGARPGPVASGKVIPAGYGGRDLDEEGGLEADPG